MESSAAKKVLPMRKTAMDKRAKFVELAQIAPRMRSRRSGSSGSLGIKMPTNFPTQTSTRSLRLSIVRLS